MFRLSADMALPSKLATLLDEFRRITDYDERAELLIEFADKFCEVPERIAKRPFDRAHLVPGCESEAYIWVEKNQDGTLKFHFAVENPQGLSAKAFAAIITETLSDLPPGGFSEVPEDIVYELFGKDLSMGKGQGLMSMLRCAKYYSAKS